MATGRQSAERTAHPKQQGRLLPFPTEPRLLRRRHDVFALPSTGFTNSLVHALQHLLRRGAACCAPARRQIDCFFAGFSKTKKYRTIQVAKGCQSSERTAGRSEARYRQK